MIVNRSAPSHEVLFAHINDFVAMNNGQSSQRLQDFSDAAAAGFRGIWNRNRRFSVSLSYYFTHHVTSVTFPFHEWASPRSLETDLSSIVLAANYSPPFPGPRQLRPYIGVGMARFHANSELNIDLVNYHEVFDVNGQILPDQHFELHSSDSTIGFIGQLGVNLDVTDRLTWHMELQGIFFSQLRQEFNYQGSLQYVNPDASGADASANDILMGSYPLELGGTRFSMGFFVAM